jgi:hypothetical protein
VILCIAKVEHYWERGGRSEARRLRREKEGEFITALE